MSENDDKDEADKDEARPEPEPASEAASKEPAAEETEARASAAADEKEATRRAAGAKHDAAAEHDEAADRTKAATRERAAKSARPSSSDDEDEAGEEERDDADDEDEEEERDDDEEEERDDDEEAAKAPPAAAKPPEKPAAKPGPAPKFKPNWRGIGIFAGGLFATFLLMAHDGQIVRGQLLGIATMAIAAIGLLDMLGLFRDRPDAVPLATTVFGALENEPVWCSPRVTMTAALCILLAGAIILGYGNMPFVVLAAMAALIPSAIRRPGFLVLIATVAIYLPFLGTYGLWDPWETHYGEVAREILARDDWISLWWAQEDWFWSKPILIFWTEALALGSLGVDFLPDANPAHPEWAIRLPVFIFSTCSVMSTYLGIGRIYGRRAGALAALVLATMPHFFLLAHQAITDMFLVSNMVMAMMCLLTAFSAEPDAEVKQFTIGKVVVSAHHAVLAGLAMICLPQALYLVSRNLAFVLNGESKGFAWHFDTFMFGSFGNDGIPGNNPPREMQPWIDGFGGQPITQGLLWALGFGVLVWFLRKERRVQALAMVAFYVFCGLGFMGKGIPGFALPGLVALLYLTASRRWSVMLEGRLRIGLGILIVTVVGMPWFVAMFVRHGPGFTDRLLVHDHINRLAAGVHGDTGSIQYFIEQLGVSMFPWVALVPAALTMFVWLRRDPAPREGTPEYHQRQTEIFVTLWFAGAFTLFSAMITKFHHYIFPAVPPAGILVGLLLDRLFGREPNGDPTRRRIGTLLAVIAPVVALFGVCGLYGDIRGVVPDDVTGAARQNWVFDHGPSAVLARGLVMVGCLLGVAAGALLLTPERTGPDARPTYREKGDPEVRDNGWEPPVVWAVMLGVPLLATFVPFVHPAIGPVLLLLVLARVGRRGAQLYEPGEQPMMVGLAIAAVAFVGFIARDLSWVTEARPHGYERLIHLFVYNYERPWPIQFDYRPMLTAFGIVATTLVAMLLSAAMRPIASRGLIGLGLAFAVWVLDIYIVDLSPHWGQRELVKAYYDARGGDDEPLIAWQMNWKGENFYTGNRVYAFVDLDNEKLREWMDDHRGQHVFFILEHTRLGNLRGVLRDRTLREVTTEKLCNKFVVVETTL